MDATEPPPPRRGRPPGTSNPPRSKLGFKPGYWVDDALCNPRTADYFFSITPAEKETALSICEHCPVREQCGEWAISRDVQGIWGGMTEEERARHRRERRSIDPVTDSDRVVPLPE